MCARLRELEPTDRDRELAAELPRRDDPFERQRRGRATTTQQLASGMAPRIGDRPGRSRPGCRAHGSHSEVAGTAHAAHWGRNNQSRAWAGVSAGTRCGCVLEGAVVIDRMLRLRARLRRRRRARRDPGLARDVTTALGDAVLDQAPAPGGQAAAAPAPPGLLARQLAVRVPRLLRAAAAYVRRRRRGRAVSAGARAPRRDDREARAHRIPTAVRAAALAPQHVPRELLRRPRARTARRSMPRASASTATSSPDRSRRSRSASARASSSCGAVHAMRRRCARSGSRIDRCRSSAVRAGRTICSTACSASTTSMTSTCRRRSTASARGA